MKTVMKSVVLLAALFLAVGAFAGDKSVTFSTTTSVNGTQLQPGEYKVSCTVNGSKADVQIKKGKNVVATATGDVVEPGRTTSRDSIVTSSNGDGTSKLVEIQFANQKTAIRISSEPSSSGGSH